MPNRAVMSLADMPTPPRAKAAGVLVSIVLAAVGCKGQLSDGPLRPTPRAAPIHVELRAARPEPNTRLLSRRELERTLSSLLLEITGDGATDFVSVPPFGSDEHAFQRVAESQAASVSSLELLEPSLEDAALRLTTEDAIATLASEACPAGRLPSEGFLVEQTDFSPIYRFVDPQVYEMPVTLPGPGEYVVRVEHDARSREQVLFMNDVEQGRAVCDARPCHWEHRFVAGEGGARVFRLEIFGSRTPIVQRMRVSSPLPDDALDEGEARACARAFGEALARRAWRRPVEGAELEGLARVYDALRPQGFAGALRGVVRAILESPYFLHLVQLGDADGRLSDHEIANRLGYAFCEGPPDAALLADASRLSDPTVRGEHARRLLRECGRETVATFFREWLGLEGLEAWTADPARFPEFTAAVPERALAQADAYFEGLVFDREASVADLYSSEVAADGLPPEVYAGERFQGLLELPALAMARSKPYGTAPVLRGVFVLERLLCAEIEPPPPGIDTDIAAADESATTRERWEAHSENPACSSCHRHIDPIGFALEDRDALGRHRADEHGRPIDATGGVPLLGIEDGAVVGTRALGERLAAAPETARCFARHWLRFSLGRLEHEGDVDALDALTRRATETSMMDAMVAIAEHDTFIQRRR